MAKPKKSWPAAGEPADVEVLCGPVVAAIRKAYKLQPRDYGTKIVWRGPSTPRDMLAHSLSFEDALTREQLEYSENDQGRSPLEVMVLIAIQLGIEQGKRIKKQEQKSAVWMLRSGLKLLEPET